MPHNAIEARRTVKPDKMTGDPIPDDLIIDALKMADWAPTHGRTEPWRFIVYNPDTITTFAADHAALYQANTLPENFKQFTFDKLLKSTEGASHVIIAYMKRGSNPNIPEIEEIAATSAAIQNLLIRATELGIATFWSTSGMTYKDAFKQYLGLGEEDKVLAILFMGYPAEEFKEGKRSVPLNDKIRWVK